MKLIWYTVLIRALPEAIGVILLCLAVIKEETDLKGILITSLPYGLVAVILRMLPLKYGINILLIVILETLIVSIILKIKIKKAFKGMLISLMVLTFLEMITLAFMQYTLKIDMNTLSSSDIGTMLAGLPSILGLYLIAFILFKINNRRKKVKNYNVNE